MPSTSQEIGTLIVVVLKANHLPNKRHIGKQDPYCVVTVNGEKRRTKAIKRGGQHPEWDEEIRFMLYEDTEDPSESTHKDVTPPPIPPKSSRGPKKIKGGRNMKIACFADDPREPDFIGEADVDLTEVLTKGETDEWFVLSNKDKFAGKVYLELTFWSNEPAPEKRVAKPQKATKYAGPGYFNPAEEQTAGHQRVTNNVNHDQQHRHSVDPVPSSLRVPNPKAQTELLYDPPYLNRHRVPLLDRVSNDFGELDITGHRSDNHPPSHGTHYSSSSLSSNYSGVPQPAHSFDFSSVDPHHAYDRPITPGGRIPSHQSNTIPGAHPLTMQPGFNASQDTGTTIYHQTVRRSRIPASSSGFVPLNIKPPINTSITSHPSDPTGFTSYNSGPLTHNAPFPTQLYTSVLSQTPAPTPAPFIQTSSSTSYAPQSYQPSQQVAVGQYGTPVTMPTPTPYVGSQLSVTPQPQQLSQNLISYANGDATPPSHEQNLPSIPPQPQLHPSPGSRPLPPQPQGTYNQSQIQGAYNPSQMIPQQHTVPTQNTVGYQTSTTYQAVPPPPPLTTVNYNTQPFPTEGQPLLPPPPPPTQAEQTAIRARRRSSLPRPPVNYVQSDIPPPPPLPTTYSHTQLPPPPQTPISQTHFSTPGPPPKPPTVPNGQTQWPPTQSLQTSYGCM